MLELPRRPEGRMQEQIEQLYRLIWKLTEEINRLEEALNSGKWKVDSGQ